MQVSGEGLHRSVRGKRVVGQVALSPADALLTTYRLVAGLVDVGSQRYWRGGGVGEAQPEPDAGTERDRNSAGIRRGGVRGSPDVRARRGGRSPSRSAVEEVGPIREKRPRTTKEEQW